MKDSGIEWVGKIPEDWDMSRLSWIVEEVNEKNKPIKTDKVLSLMKDIGVIPYDEKGDIGNKSKENLEDYKIAYKNTIVINSMNVIIGSVGLSKYFGAVSPVYYVYKTLSGKANIEYLNYIFQTKEFQQELKKYGKGIMEIRLRITSSDIKKNFVPFPNITIQSKIASFLDEKCEIIDEQIENNKKSIELLEEYKKSLTKKTIATGKLIRLKYVFNKFGSGTTPNSNNNKYYYDGIYNWIQSGDINGSFIDYTTKKITEFAIQNCKSLNYYFSPFIVIAMYGASVGNFSISNINAYTNQACCVMTHTKENMKFLFYSIGTTKEKIMSFALGGTQPNINRNVLRNLKIQVPPIEEQKEIVDYLDDKCYKIDKVIEYRKQIIEKLEEYKKSLIYEAVTGKIEV